MLKLSHVLLKVADLDEAVARYRDKGFEIDYGRVKNPNNALIYFADGSYLELLWRTGLPSWAQIPLRLFGKKAFVSRLNSWDGADEGLVGLALESEPGRLDETKRVLERAGQGYFQFKSGRLDPQGRDLKFVGVMPDEMKIPFFGSCNTDLRCQGFVHPNGVVGFKSISFGTSEELLPIINGFCDDERVKFFIGDGVKDLEFEMS